MVGGDPICAARSEKGERKLVEYENCQCAWIYSTLSNAKAGSKKGAPMLDDAYPYEGGVILTAGFGCADLPSARGNTLIYLQLIDFEISDYHSATANTTKEAKQLVEGGFEYVCITPKNIMPFRKRK